MGERRKPRLREDLDRELFVGAGESDDEGHLERKCPRGLDDAVSDVVAAGDAAEDVEQDGPDARIGGGDLGGADHLLRVRAPPGGEEIGGGAPRGPYGIPSLPPPP